MNMATHIIHERLRIGGEQIDRTERIEVFNPYDGSLVGIRRGDNDAAGTVCGCDHCHRKGTFDRSGAAVESQFADDGVVFE